MLGGLSTLHAHILVLLDRDLLSRSLSIHRRTLNPKHIITSDQDLAKRGSHLLVNVLLGVGELDVHVGVDGDEDAAVLGLSPFEADDDFFVDAAAPQSVRFENSGATVVAARKRLSLKRNCVAAMRSK